MKIFKLFTTMLLSASLFSANAQSDIPAGYTPGTVTLANGSTISGLIKNNIRKNASVTVINETDKKKTDYNGDDLLTAQVDGINCDGPIAPPHPVLTPPRISGHDTDLVRASKPRISEIARKTG